MEAKEKAKELFEKYWCLQWQIHTSTKKFKLQSMSKSAAKQCAIIAVKNEYHALREQLFNLRACGVIESAQTYLGRLDILNEEEEQVKTEINNL